MADETELAPEAGTEPLTPPVEGDDKEQAAQVDPAVVALASDLGWVPQDQFRGSADEWKPADEFIRASRDINRSLSRELRGVREQLSRVGNVTDQIVADKIAERDAYWQNQHRQAVEDGNHELAGKAVGELIKLKEAAPAQADGEPAETREFRDRHNAWFGKDRRATALAMRVAEESRQMGATVAEQLKDAEEEVRRQRPDLFPQSKQPPAVQTGRSRNGGGGTGRKGFADMPAESQRMAQDYLKRHGMPVEKFAESYWADQAQNERRVG